MATAKFMSPVPDLKPYQDAGGTDYLQMVKKFIQDFKPRLEPLKKPANAIFRFKELEDTIYRSRPALVKAWSQFYLPKEQNMLVVGVVEGTSCQCKELVLMVCEDGKLYGFDGEELHLVASSLNQMLQTKEIQFPSSETYYYGQAFENMTAKDWEAVKAGPVGKRLDAEYKRMVDKRTSAFLQKLKAAAH